MNFSLGRNVLHDPLSLAFEHVTRTAQPQGVNTFWDSAAGPLDQGQLGSCTGNAVAQWLNTNFANPVRAADNKGQFLTEADAVKIYSLGTQLDGSPEHYPPVDTGCDGNSVAKAAAQLGYLSSWNHTFSLSAMQTTLESTPVICGTSWTNDMFNPVNGLVEVGSLLESNVAGGHEYLGAGVDWVNEVFIFRNSWGDAWTGSKPGGYFAIGFLDYQRLLDDNGDVTVPIGKTT